MKLLQAINAMCHNGLICKFKKQTRVGDFTDNTYTIFIFVYGSIKKKCKKIMSLLCTGKLTIKENDVKSSINKIHNTSRGIICQERYTIFFKGGGGKNATSYILPTNLFTIRKTNDKMIR